MEDDRLEFLGGSVYHEVWDLAAPLAASGQQALDLKRTSQMGSSDVVSSVVEVSASEHVQRRGNAVLAAARRSAQRFVDRVLDGGRTKLSGAIGPSVRLPSTVSVLLRR